MTLLQWFIFFLAVQVIHYLGTWKLYQKAGRKPWEAAVPVYNAVVLMRIIRKPRWWVILLFIPIVNLIMFPDGDFNLSVICQLMDTQFSCITPQSTVKQLFDVWISDNFGNEWQVSFSLTAAIDD